MSFDLGLTGGDGGQYIRYNASTGTWQVDGEMVQVGQFVIDHNSLKTGWGKIVAGMGPEWSWDERPGVKGQQPSDEHKRGFSLQIYSKSFGQREWSTNSAGSNRGLTAIWGAVSDQAAANAGKLPVVKFNGATPTSVGKGMTQVPNFTLEKWIDPPADFGIQGRAMAAPAAPAATAPKPVAVVEDEF